MSTTTLHRRRSSAPVDDVEIDIDPRIADRRDAVQRAHRRKRRRMLVALSVVTVLALAGVGLTRSAALDVDHIEVLGADRTSVEGLIGASGLSLGAPMTELDLAGARQAIADLPWIADVRVKRQWPNRISIAVLERVPVAAVPTVDERWALVDEAGHVLSVSDAVSERWVSIEGVPAAEGPGTRVDDRASDALELAARLPADLRSGLARIVIEDDGELVLKFDTGPTLLVGSTADLDAKLGAALAVFQQVDDCGIDVIDVRTVDLISVTRVPSCRPDAVAAADDATATGVDPATATATGPTAGTGATTDADLGAGATEGDGDG